MLHLLLLGLSPLVQDTTYSDWERTGIDLDQVVITATRTPKLLKETPIPTHLISGVQLRRIDATQVSDLLTQEMPGVEFSYSMNMQVNMNMAGFAGQSVLFLVDGERMAGETNDNVDFERLTTSDIARVEIVKGAASALYGSSANGGVINIISRPIYSMPTWSSRLYARAGSHGEQRYGVDCGVHRGGWANRLNLSYNTRDCFRLHNRDNSSLPLRIDYVPGQETWQVKDRLSYRFSSDLTLSGRAGYYRREMIRSARESEHARYYDYEAALRADWEASELDHVEAVYHFDQYDKTRYYVPSALAVSDRNVREYSNVQNSVRTLWTHQLASATLTAGMDYMYDYLVNAKLSHADYHQSMADAFVQYDRKLGQQWEVIGALRYDFMEQGHRSQLTPKISTAWHRNDLMVRGSYGMGFRAPSLKELHYDFEAMSGWIIEGNPNLVPERSHNFTLSADYAHGPCTFTLMGYYNHITDRITTGVPQPQSDGAHLPYINLPKVDVMGGEAAVQAHWSNGLGARASYCYTREHKPGQAPNQFMPARPHALTYRIDYGHGWGRNYRMDLSLNGRWLSSVSNREYRSTQHPEQGVLLVHYPGYHLHKLQISQHWRDWVTLACTIDNLLDYKPDNYFYNAPLTQGREYSVSLTLELE